MTVAALRLTITDPVDGATVPTGHLLVRGTVEAGGAEVGVAVNRVPAIVRGTTFVAQVPLAASTTALEAVATAAAGASATHTIGVTAEPATLPVVLRSSPGLGLAPLSVTFTLSGVPSNTPVAWDLDGDGVADQATPAAAPPGFTYAQPGLYVPTARFADSQGKPRTVWAAVQVLDRAALEATTQARWAAMKDALRAGDIPRALTHLATSARPHYDEAFRLLASRLTGNDAILTDLTFVGAHLPRHPRAVAATDSCRGAAGLRGAGAPRLHQVGALAPTWCNSRGMPSMPKRCKYKELKTSR